jgi:uncharacterized protein (DUF1800 family)
MNHKTDENVKHLQRKYNKLSPQNRDSLIFGSDKPARHSAMAFAPIPGQMFGLAAVALAILFAPASPSAASPESEVVANQDIALSPQDLGLLNRITWGANPSSARALAKLGADVFLDQQLHPPKVDRLPAHAQAQIDALTISQTPPAKLAIDLEQQRRDALAIADPEQKRQARRAYRQALTQVGREAAARSLLRDLYSPDQLKEQLTWFWLNHFNVHANKGNIRALIGDYEDTAIRQHALGKFRDLLAATLHHPAMLIYLDNNRNAVGRINENYAREIMELHTLGVGSGYTQADVQELARILTGVGVNRTPDNPNVRPALRDQFVRDGLFVFNPNRHDYGDKTFLGRRIAGSGLKEVDQALDILARAPATSRYVSRKLALYFVSDNPPPDLVERMAATFRKTDGDIVAVLKTMFDSAEFKNSLGTRFKDPIHFVVSAIRLAYDDRPIVNAMPMQGWLNRMAEPLYGRQTPDGYGLAEAAWVSPGQMVTRFEIARMIGSGSAPLFRSATAVEPSAPLAPRIADNPSLASLRPPLSAETRQALNEATSPQDWNTLFLASPEFMRR